MNKIKVTVIFYLAISISGCLKDNPLEIPSFKITNTMEILSHFERSGDYINSSAPSFISAAEVYSNMGIYLVLDVRSTESFLKGHIHEAVNIRNDSLFSYIESHNKMYEKVVLVSETGHSSAYYTSLLRLAGFNNIYSMKFGMAYWHNDFAKEWLESIQYYPDVNKFVDYDSDKNKMGSLPAVSFSDNKSFEENIMERIRLLVAEGFGEEEVGSNKIFESANLITIEKIYDYFEQKGKSDLYIICFGPSGLYKSLKLDPIPNTGHPEGAILYETGDFRSINYLQTLPLNKPIAIYDYNGQTAAFMTAYLRVVGYNVKIIPYGANHFFYYRLKILNHPEAFDPNNIKNYEYDK